MGSCSKSLRVHQFSIRFSDIEIDCFEYNCIVSDRVNACVFMCFFFGVMLPCNPLTIQIKFA